MLRRALTTLVAVVTLVMVVKILVAPSKTDAGTEAMKSPIQNAMSTYDLQARYPNMKNLPTDRIPQP